MWKRYIIFECVLSFLFVLFTKDSRFLTPTCIFLVVYFALKAIEEMLDDRIEKLIKERKQDEDCK